MKRNKKRQRGLNKNKKNLQKTTASSEKHVHPDSNISNHSSDLVDLSVPLITFDAVLNSIPVPEDENNLSAFTDDLEDKEENKEGHYLHEEKNKHDSDDDKHEHDDDEHDEYEHDEDLSEHQVATKKRRISYSSFNSKTDWLKRTKHFLYNLEEYHAAILIGYVLGYTTHALPSWFGY